MKKFLAIMLSIIVVVALGFTVFYLVRDNEEIYLSTSSIYVSKGDTFDIDINFKNKKSYTDYEILVDKSSVVKYNEESGNFTALAGGYTKVLFRTSNVNYRNLDCVVYVGDGNATSPFYITSTEQILQIGKKDEEGNCRYPLDAYYALRSNIALSDAAVENLGYWSPIGYDAKTGEVEAFTGQFDGRGYTISNMALDKAAFNNDLSNTELDLPAQNYTYAGLFAKLGANAVVKNVKFENATITGEYEYAGVVAGVSESADIERVEIKSATLDLTNTNVAGTVVGKMVSTVVSQAYVSSSLDRVSAVVTVKNPSKVFGGLVGENHGGYVVYSYATGNVELYNEYSKLVVGGIVGSNKTTSNSVSSRTVYSGASVKDCYTNLSFAYNVAEGKTANINNVTAGMIVGENITGTKTKDYGTGAKTTYLNKLIGNYYNSDSANVSADGTSKSFVGVGTYTNISGTYIAYNDEIYVITGATAKNMKLAETYVSHVSNGDIILWKFGTVWIETNNDFPKLDYVEQAVSPEIDGIEDAEVANTVDRFLELLNDKNTTSIVIGANLDFSGKTWEVKELKNIKIYADYDETKTSADGSKVYYKLLNIKTNNSLNNNPLEYASLFSYIGKDAELHNITLENATFTNGNYSAGFAYKNEGLIQDCAIVNSTIIGKKEASGIVINNDGIISKSSQQTKDANGNIAYVYGKGVFVEDTSITVQINETSNVLAGDVKASGIAIVNTKNISGVVVRGNTNSVSIKVKSTGSVANAKIAGAVVENNGSISNVNVSFVADSDGIKAEGSFKAEAAGLSVVNSGSIKNSYVSSNIYTYSGNDGNMSAGLVAEIVDTGMIENCGFYGNNKVIEGYRSAGIAVTLSQTALRKISLNGWDAFWGNAKLNTTKAEMGNGVVKCYIAGSTTVYGHNVAGLVISISNGAVLDSYVGTNVTLKGLNSNSTVANFAISVSCNINNKENGKFSTGIIAYCYSDASLDNSGTTYGVAGDNILAVASNESKKNCGFGISLIVSKSKTSGTKFFDEDLLHPQNWGSAGQGNCKASDSEMHTNNGGDNKFRNFGFVTEIWSFDTNQLGKSKTDVGPTVSDGLVNTSLLNIN